MSDKIFGEGIIFKRPRDGAPSFVKGNISVKVEEFIKFLNTHTKNGWVNLDLKESQGGKLYLELNTWSKEEKKLETPKTVTQQVEYPKDIINPDDIPF